MRLFPGQFILFRATKLTFIMKNLEYGTSSIKYIKYSPILYKKKNTNLTVLAKWAFKDFMWGLLSVLGGFILHFLFTFFNFQPKWNSSFPMNTALMFWPLFDSSGWCPPVWLRSAGQWELSIWCPKCLEAEAGQSGGGAKYWKERSPEVGREY